MGKTNIQWCDHTGGPWLICTEVSPGCARCYARKLMEARLAPIVRKAYRLAGLKDWETRPVWGDKAPRVLTKGFWRQARALDRAAAKTGARHRIFPSMIDWLDEMPAGIIDQQGNWLDPIRVRADFLQTIHDTPNLDWLLLTKRPENFFTRTQQVGIVRGPVTFEDASFHAWLTNMRLGWKDVTYSAPEVGRENYWIGTSVEDQKRADQRIPALLKIPAKIRFLSIEPMLEPIDLTRVNFPISENVLYCSVSEMARRAGRDKLNGIDWVIVGNESRPGKAVGRLPHNSEEGFWHAARNIMHQCREAGVPFFMKQGPIDGKTSGDPAQWPQDMRVREFPETTT